jgi:hypothetical protein
MLSVARRGPTNKTRNPMLVMPFRCQKNNQGMTAEQARQVPQACDLPWWVGLAGLEPATERL